MDGLAGYSLAHVHGVKTTDGYTLTFSVPVVCPHCGYTVSMYANGHFSNGLDTAELRVATQIAGGGGMTTITWQLVQDGYVLTQHIHSCTALPSDIRNSLTHVVQMVQNMNATFSQYMQLQAKIDRQATEIVDLQSQVEMLTDQVKWAVKDRERALNCLEQERKR